MKNEGYVKELFSLTWKLGIICIIVAGLLALINSITAPIIKANDEENFSLAMAEVLPNADVYEKMNFNYIPSEEGVKLDSIYRAVDRGFVVTTVCSEGYGGDIKVIVGINSDMTVNKVKIVSIAETAGLGMKANKDEYTDQYIGLKSNIGVEKNNAGTSDKNTISAISGATITSKAVTKAVNCALEVAEIGGAI